MADYLTLPEFSQLKADNGDLLTSGIVDTMIKEGGMFIEKLPIKTVGKLKATGSRIKDLPTPQNRQLNGRYTHDVGHNEPLEETVFMYGGRVDLDYLLDGSGENMIEDPEAFQLRLHVMAQTYQLKYDILNNTPGDNANGIVGLRHRLANDLPSAQRINAGALDISDDGGGTDDAAFMQKMRHLMYALPDHTADLLLMNDTTLLAFRRVLENLKLLKTTEDQFGREILRWGDGGPFLVDMGVKGDQTTKIITDLESATGVAHNGGGTLTSIFGVRFGPEYLTGWEKQGMTTWRWQEGPIKSVEFDWPLGIFITNPRSVAQLYNIQAA